MDANQQKLLQESLEQTAQQNVAINSAAANGAEQRRDDLLGSLFQSVTGTFKVFSVYIGHKLGYYDILASSASLNSPELASASGTNERYAREWLEQQTVAGILEVQDASAGPRERRYFLPAGHDEVLTDLESLNYFSPIIQIAVSTTRPVESLLRAYRDGGGLALSEYGEDFVQGQGGANRATFLQELGQVWLPALPDIHQRLSTNPPARVADFGCGIGWSSIGMAQSYPNILVDGFDLDEPSIAVARENAHQSGLAGRVNFQVRDAADPEFAGSYDLVTAFECIHDMSNPVGALTTMRRLLNSGGAVLVADERVGETFTPKGNDVEELMYGFSIMHCLPVGMYDQPSHGTGTVMRPDTLREYALQAGFRTVEILPVENFFFRLYLLKA